MPWNAAKARERFLMEAPGGCYSVPRVSIPDISRGAVDDHARYRPKTHTDLPDIMDCEHIVKVQPLRANVQKHVRGLRHEGLGVSIQRLQEDRRVRVHVRHARNRWRGAAGS